MHVCTLASDRDHDAGNFISKPDADRQTRVMHALMRNISYRYRLGCIGVHVPSRAPLSRRITIARAASIVRLCELFLEFDKRIYKKKINRI